MHKHPLQLATDNCSSGCQAWRTCSLPPVLYSSHYVYNTITGVHIYMYVHDFKELHVLEIVSAYIPMSSLSPQYILSLSFPQCPYIPLSLKHYCSHKATIIFVLCTYYLFYILVLHLQCSVGQPHMTVHVEFHTCNISSSSHSLKGKLWLIHCLQSVTIWLLQLQQWFILLCLNRKQVASAYSTGHELEQFTHNSN